MQYLTRMRQREEASRSAGIDFDALVGGLPSQATTMTDVNACLTAVEACLKGGQPLKAAGIVLSRLVDGDGEPVSFMRPGQCARAVAQLGELLVVPTLTRRTIADLTVFQAGLLDQLGDIPAVADNLNVAIGIYKDLKLTEAAAAAEKKIGNLVFMVG